MSKVAEGSGVISLNDRIHPAPISVKVVENDGFKMLIVSQKETGLTVSVMINPEVKKILTGLHD